jgi:predicted amidophosphoribosyltransferase
MIAKEMSEQLSLPMRAPPLSQCWRWTKSSHTPKHQIRESHYQLNASKFRAHALVVDDVATTGTTLTELALYLLRKNIYVEALVYAKAGRHLGHICK